MGRGHSSRRGYPLIGGNRRRQRATDESGNELPLVPARSADEILAEIVRASAEAHYPDATGAETAPTGRTKGAVAAAAIMRTTGMLDEMTRNLGAGIRDCFAAGDAKGALKIQAKAVNLSTDVESQDEPTPEQALAATRIAKAEVHLGAPTDPMAWVNFSSELMSDKGIARRLLRRRFGDRVEREAALFEDLRHTGLATSSEAILAQVRAALRNPNAYQSAAEVVDGAVFGGPQERTTPKMISIAADHNSLRDLIADDWADASHAVTVETGEGIVGRQVVVSLLLANPATAEGPIALEAWSAIPEGGEDDLYSYLGEIKASTKADCQPRPGTLVTYHHEPETSVAWSLRPTPLNVLGSDNCNHHEGEWHPEALPGHATDCMRLSCPDCLRNRIAVVPLHCIDADDEIIADPEDYLAVARYHASLSGDQRKIVSIDQLRARDGIQSIIPEDYASRQDLGPRQIRSVGDAMKRR